MSNEASPNTLGLAFDQLQVTDSTTNDPSTETSAGDIKATQLEKQEPKPSATDKKKPYINPDRVKTGGAQRDKLTEDELTERMAKIREQNEKIKQRRLDVKADEEAFRKTQEADRVKIAQNRRVQQNIDHTREQNAKRKMDKIQSREWDSGKPVGDWKGSRKQASSAVPPSESPEASTDHPAPEASPSAISDQPVNYRGGYRGRPPRGRGRGRSRGPAHPKDAVSSEAPLEEPSEPSFSSVTDKSTAST